MSHFTHTKEGVADALGFSVVSQVNRLIKLACSTGHIVSQIKGGIEYFDVDILERYGTVKKEEEVVVDYSMDMGYIEVEVTRTKSSNKKTKKKKIAEEPVEQFYDYSNRVQAVFLFD